MRWPGLAALKLMIMVFDTEGWFVCPSSLVHAILGLQRHAALLLLLLKGSMALPSCTFFTTTCEHALMISALLAWRGVEHRGLVSWN